MGRIRLQSQGVGGQQCGILPNYFGHFSGLQGLRSLMSLFLVIMKMVGAWLL